MRSTKKLTVGLVAALIGVLCAAGCVYSWDIPARKDGKYAAHDIEGSRDLAIPQLLLSDTSTADAARNCGIQANRFRESSSGNHFWSVVFGMLQIGGATTGTVASGAAFGSNGTDTAAKIAAISFAVAAGIAALDRAYDPGKRATHEAQVELKIGHIILLAAGQSATGDVKAARDTLALCQDPADVDDNRTLIDISQIQDQLKKLLAGQSRDAGQPEGDVKAGGSANAND